MPRPEAIHDTFERGVSPYWVRFATGHAAIENEPGRVRFALEGAVEGELSDAEIGDHRGVPRARLAWEPPLTLTVRARFSHPSGGLSGTAGFGFWNDPFDWTGKVQAPPNAIWFFYASPPGNMSFVRGVRGDGWKAALINGGRAGRAVMAAGNLVFRLPGMSRLVFAAAERRIGAAEVLLDEFSMTDWRLYELDWGTTEAVFRVDGRQVLRAPAPPRTPLGFVAWIDNNCTTMGPGKDFSFRRLAIAQRQSMELSLLRIQGKIL